jgi:hypothetical protein
VPGAQFDRTLSLNIVASTQGELQAALAPLVSDADTADPVQRRHARAAIVESAPPFLDSLIARFAAEDQFDHSAIEALGRIATPRTRAYLKTLFRSSAGSRPFTIVLALARIGHRDDPEFFATVLQDATVDQASRRHAALGLGHVGWQSSSAVPRARVDSCAAHRRSASTSRFLTMWLTVRRVHVWAEARTASTDSARRSGFS